MDNEGPDPLDSAVLVRMDPNTRTYVTRREAAWEAALDAERNVRADTMEVCSAYNRQVEALNRE